MIKSFTIDKAEDEKSVSIGKAYGKETFIMLGACLLVLWLGEEFNF